MAPLEALTDSLLSDPERRVLLALFSWRGKATNTVWPSMSEIGERANISDLTRISKITTSLAAKGWLTKKKKGFTGCNEYCLTFPDRLETEDSNLDSDTNLASNAKLDENTNSNLDSDTKSMLVPDTKYKEQTNEQTIEQTNIKKNKQKKSRLDFSSWPELPSEQTMSDWTAMRKRLKADVSQTVVNRFAKELHKAKKYGYTVDDCLAECITRGWRGFECQWLLNNNSGLNHATNQQRSSTGSGSGKASPSDFVRSQAKQFFEQQGGATGGAVVHAPG